MPMTITGVCYISYITNYSVHTALLDLAILLTPFTAFHPPPPPPPSANANSVSRNTVESRYQKSCFYVMFQFLHSVLNLYILHHTT